MFRNSCFESWSNVSFDFDFINDYRLEVSTFGRLRSFNKQSDGNIVKGSEINGYKIIRLKFFRQRDPKMQSILDEMQQDIFAEARKLKQLKLENDSLKIATANELLIKKKKALRKKYSKDTRQRTINYHCLTHRLVAQYFLPLPQKDQTIVAHLDFNKHNNHFSNLKWMTPEENYLHQQNSPYVIKEKAERKDREYSKTKIAKLTVTRIMLLKKLIAQGKPMKQLVKQFKVTDTQILRIKRGENWAGIEAAK